MQALSHALVLAAGLGTRLDPLTRARAKPAIPVAGEPVVRRILRWLASHDVSEVVVNLHHLPETIAAVIGDGRDLGVHVRYSWEQPVVLGSAGGPRHALATIGAPRFLIVNGDTMADVDLGGLAEQHARSGAQVTLAVTPNRASDRYSGLRIDDRRHVGRGVVPRGATEPSFHFVGVQVVDAAVFQHLPPGVPMRSIGGVYDELMGTQPGSVQGFVCGAAFIDIGTHADYWQASLQLATDAHWHDVPQWGLRPHVAASARVERSILWDDVTVGEDAVLEECVVTDGVVVPPGARHHRQVLVRPAGTDALLVAPFRI